MASGTRNSIREAERVTLSSHPISDHLLPLTREGGATYSEPWLWGNEEVCGSQDRLWGNNSTKSSVPYHTKSLFFIHTKSSMGPNGSPGQLSSTYWFSIPGCFDIVSSPCQLMLSSLLQQWERLGITVWLFITTLAWKQPYSDTVYWSE